jgi:hypothetical protein
MKEGMARSYVNNTKRTASLDLQFVLAVKETVDIGRHEGCGERSCQGLGHAITT